MNEIKRTDKSPIEGSESIPNRVFSDLHNLVQKQNDIAIQKERYGWYGEDKTQPSGRKVAITIF